MSPSPLAAWLAPQWGSECKSPTQPLSKMVQEVLGALNVCITNWKDTVVTRSWVLCCRNRALTSGAYRYGVCAAAVLREHATSAFSGRRTTNVQATRQHGEQLGMRARRSKGCAGTTRSSRYRIAGSGCPAWGKVGSCQNCLEERYTAHFGLWQALVFPFWACGQVEQCVRWQHLRSGCMCAWMYSFGPLPESSPVPPGPTRVTELVAASSRT